MGSLLSKPLQGGLFGQDEYELASVPRVERGLHSVQYLVIQRRAGIVVAIGDEKAEAIATARRVISAASELRSANDSVGPRQSKLWPDEELPIIDEPAQVRAVSRRRREVFERSRGHCFYCADPLQIENFEVEHMRPRALGGDDDPLNIVAACRRCNRKKGDRTALEYLAVRGQS